jgi:hypothetical protein
MKAIRAVASANGKNRFDSCALSSCNWYNGSLTGYAGGLWRSEHENPTTQQSLF